MVKSVGKWDQGARVRQAHETPCPWKVGEQHSIAPDYSNIAHYTVKRDYGPRRPEYIPVFAAIAWGVIAALVVVVWAALV